MVEIVNLSKMFRRRRALDGVSLNVAQGEKIAVLGGNGAGKSTLLRVLASVIPPTEGSVRLDGAELFGAGPALRAGVGFMPEGAPLYPDMRVAEFLKFAGRLRGLGSARLHRRAHDVAALCGLSAMRDSLASRLSNGERRRVSLAAALLHEPRLLLLDDPTAGLDAVHAEKMISIISGKELDGVTVIFATHSRELAAAATRSVTLSAGKIVEDSASAKIEAEDARDASRDAETEDARDARDAQDSPDLRQGRDSATGATGAKSESGAESGSEAASDSGAASGKDLHSQSHAKDQRS